MIIKEVTDENKCCCSCKNNIRTPIDDVHVRCNCDKDGHYIGYVSDATATKMVIISDMLLILRVYVMSGR